jgi:hypothetical protein
MTEFLKTWNQPTLNHEEIKNLNRSITSKKIESVNKNIPTKERLGPDDLTREFYQLISILLKLLQKIKEDGALPNSFYEASIT